MSAVHPFASSLAKRVTLVSLAGACLAAAIVVATDERTSTTAMRIARLGALGPLIACLSVLAVCAHAHARGEIGALEALGMRPWEAARGAEIAGWAFGAMSLFVLALPWTDPSSLFPAFLPPLDWVMDAGGDAARSTAATVFADGTIRLAEHATARIASSPGSAAALACLIPVAFAGPAWAVTPMRGRLRVLSVSTAATLLIVVLHALAARRAAVWCGVFASAPLWAALTHARRAHSAG